MKVSPNWSIFSSTALTLRQIRERTEVLPLFTHLPSKLPLLDVEFTAVDPPDFLFHTPRFVIGAELTRLPPRCSKSKGYTRIAKYKDWRPSPSAEPSVFEWGTYTVRDSLSALVDRIQQKSNHVKKWSVNVAERWLLLRIHSGSPFGSLVANHPEIEAEDHREVADHLGRVTLEIHKICQQQNAFDYVLLFTTSGLKAFTPDGDNPHNLPSPTAETLLRGKLAPDTHLDWSTGYQTRRHFHRLPIQPNT